MRRPRAWLATRFSGAPGHRPTGTRTGLRGASLDEGVRGVGNATYSIFPGSAAPTPKTPQWSARRAHAHPIARVRAAPQQRGEEFVSAASALHSPRLGERKKGRRAARRPVSPGCGALARANAPGLFDIVKKDTCSRMERRPNTGGYVSRIGLRFIRATGTREEFMLGPHAVRTSEPPRGPGGVRPAWNAPMIPLR
jgi:hypothetical protein